MNNDKMTKTEIDGKVKSLNHDSVSTIKKYKTILNVFQICGCGAGPSCEHHVSPKAIFPERANDPKNVVKIPLVVHWAVHELLVRHYSEIGNVAHAEAMRKERDAVASRINCGGESRYEFDFARNGNSIVRFIFSLAVGYCLEQEAMLRNVGDSSLCKYANGLLHVGDLVGAKFGSQKKNELDIGNEMRDIANIVMGRSDSDVGQGGEYKKMYDDLIAKYVENPIEANEGTSVHHIKPKCLYPECEKDRDNMVVVPKREHARLHQLSWLHCKYEEKDEFRAWKMLKAYWGVLNVLKRTGINWETDPGLAFVRETADEMKKDYSEGTSKYNPMYDEEAKKKRFESMNDPEGGKKSGKSGEKRVVEFDSDDRFFALYASVRAAAIKANRSSTSISLCCSGKTKSVKGHTFRFLEDLERDGSAAKLRLVA